MQDGDFARQGQADRFLVQVLWTLLLLDGLLCHVFSFDQDYLERVIVAEAVNLGSPLQRVFLSFF